MSIFVMSIIIYRKSFRLVDFSVQVFLTCFFTKNTILKVQTSSRKDLNRISPQVKKNCGNSVTLANNVC